MKKIIAKILLLSMIVTSTSSLSFNTTYAQSIPTSTNAEQKINSNNLKVVDQYERPIKKDVTFTLSSFDGSKRTEIGEYTAKNGVLSGINFENGKTYSLEVKGNEHEDIEDGGFLLIKTDDGFTDFNDENINNTISVINKYTQELEIKSEGKEITEELEFDVTIGNKTEKIKSEKSKLYFDIKDNELATIKLNNDKYQMDDIKLTLKKDKSKPFGPSALFNEKDEKITKLSLMSKQNESIDNEEIEEKAVLVNVDDKSAPAGIKFELITEGTNTKISTDNNGSLNLKLDPKKSYTLKLVDEKYEMKDVSFTLKKETNFMGLEVYNLYSNDKKLDNVNITTKKDTPQPENPGNEAGERPCPSQECHFSNNKINTKELQIYNINGQKISEDVHFKLFNGTKQEYFGDVTAKNGVFPSLGLYENDTYIIYCTDKKYTISDKPYELEVNQLYIKPNGEGKVPVRNRTSKKYEDSVSINIEKINVRELKSGEQNKEKTHFEIPVYYGSAPYQGAGNVILTSQFEELKVPVKNGKISVDLLEDIQYAVSFEDPFNEFGIENFPMTVKDKSERTGKDPLATGRGKYVYDHSTCRSVPKLQLIDIKDINKNNSKVICSKGNTIVTGMNFKDLLLATGHIKKETVEEFKNKDVDIFEIHLINPRRCEVSKVAKGNFNILKIIHNGKTVKKAYLTKNGKIIKEVPLEQDKQDKTKVNVKVDSMSIYDLAFEYESTTDPNPSTPEEDKDNKKIEEKINELESEVDNLNKDNENLKNSNEQLNKKVDELNKKVDELNKDVESLKSDNSTQKQEYEKKIDELNKKIKQLSEDKNKDNSNNEDEKQIEDLKKQIEDLNSKSTSQKQDYEKKIDELNKKIDEAKKNNSYHIITPQAPSTSTNNTENKDEKNKSTIPVRISGSDRISTSLEVSKKFFNSSDYVIIASGENYSDALVSSSLAKMLNCPIILTNKNHVRDDVKEELERLKAKHIVFIGGENSVSNDVKSELSKYNTERISGKDRYETSALVYEKLINLGLNPNGVVLASGEVFADALSAGSISSKDCTPILLTKHDSIPESVRKHIGNNVVIIGGENSVSKSIENKLQNSVRLNGKNRYETSMKVANYAFKNNDKTILASGEDYPDALVASVASNKLQAPIVLSPKDSSQILYNKTNVFVIGGENSIKIETVK